MSLGPVPRKAAHAVRHPLEGRETTKDCGMNDAYYKRPPVPRSQRAQKQLPSCGALHRERARYGAEAPALPGAAPRKASEERRPRSRDARSESPAPRHGRVNGLLREEQDPGCQTFEWGPQRRDQKPAGTNYGRAHTLEQERMVEGQTAPWSAPAPDSAVALQCLERQRGRRNVLENELRAQDQERQQERAAAGADPKKNIARRNLLLMENQGPQQLASDPVDTFARVGVGKYI